MVRGAPAFDISAAHPLTVTRSSSTRFSSSMEPFTFAVPLRPAALTAVIRVLVSDTTDEAIIATAGLGGLAGFVNRIVAKKLRMRITVPPNPVTHGLFNTDNFKVGRLDCIDIPW